MSAAEYRIPTCMASGHSESPSHLRPGSHAPWAGKALHRAQGADQLGCGLLPTGRPGKRNPGPEPSPVGPVPQPGTVLMEDGRSRPSLSMAESLAAQDRESMTEADTGRGPWPPTPFSSFQGSLRKTQWFQISSGQKSHWTITSQGRLFVLSLPVDSLTSYTLYLCQQTLN